MSQDLAARYQSRLQDLRNEYASGQEQLRALDIRKVQLQETMIRISGAIHVLEEMIAEEKARADG